MSNKFIGKNGEDIACEYLQKLGYKIIDRNICFSRYCELDIVAVDKSGILVAVEVKTRKTDICGDPLEAITRNKYKNIKLGLFNYLKTHPEYKKFRIDAIAIILGTPVSINHIKNI